jgi:hypothetical protein
MNGRQGTSAEYGVYRSQTSTSASKHDIDINKLVHMRTCTCTEGRKDKKKKRKRNPAQTLFGDTDGRFVSGEAFSRRYAVSKEKVRDKNI